MTATTEIKPDGSWTRTLNLRVGSADAPDALAVGVSSALNEAADGKNQDDKQAQARAVAAKAEAQVQAIKKQFFVPAGPGWAVTRQREGDEMTLVAQSAAPLAPGGTLRQDVAVRGKVNGQPGRLVVNEVSVRPLGAGRVEYRETLRWQGKRPDEFTKPQPEAVRALREVLPASVAADEKALDAIAVQTQREAWRLLFGPGDPLLGQMIAHTDLAERRLRQRLGRSLVRTLETTFGDRLTDGERRAAARKLAEGNLGTLMDKARLDKGSIAGAGSAAAARIRPGNKEDQNHDLALAALTFTLKPPGRVVETNGEYDELTGEVFWTLYTEAVVAGDVTLRAVCETPGAAAANRSPAATSFAAR